MNRMICGTLLLFASVSLAQQRDPPPYSTPPTFPTDRDAPMPPDTSAPAPEAGDSQAETAATSAEIADQIQGALDTEPLLKTSDLKVSVDDATVTLTGIVASQKDREVALSILALHAGKREIVDQTKLRT
jgi:hypothetical protein